MYPRKRDSSSPKYKNQSPRPSSQLSSVNSPRLPNINLTQKLSEKYFVSARGNASKVNPRKLVTKIAILDVPSPKEENKSLSQREPDNSPKETLKQSCSQSILDDCSTKFREQREISYLSQEIEKLHAKTKQLVREI